MGQGVVEPLSTIKKSILILQGSGPIRGGVVIGDYIRGDESCWEVWTDSPDSMAESPPTAGTEQATSDPLEKSAHCSDWNGDETMSSSLTAGQSTRWSGPGGRRWNRRKPRKAKPRSQSRTSQEEILNEVWKIMAELALVLDALA